MAFFQSLGPRKPAAFDFLVAESLLQPDALPDHYSWETYNDGQAEEELLTTESCVVWSRGGAICRFARFDAESETVHQTLLTWFPSNIHQEQSGTAAAVFKKTRTRALVTLLKHHAHIYLLDGPSHVVNLPFQVERAFAAPQGVILLRKLPMADTLPPTPLPPAVPQNSFLNSQAHLWSPQATRQHQALPERRRSSAYGFKPPRSLSDLAISPETMPEDTLPRVFALTDPLSEVGLVVEALLHSRGSKMSNETEWESINKAETVLYVSHSDEFAPQSSDAQPLILIVTFNHLEAKYTIWYAMYIAARAFGAPEKRKRDSLPSLRTKRRSSRVARLSTGVNTPALRANGFEMEQLQPGHASQQSFGKPELSSQNAIGEGDLDATIESTFNLQDEFAPSNRRTSSMMARAELSSQDQHTFSDLARNPVGLGSSFGTSNRKQGSFGSFNDRASFGKSRTSGRISTGSMSRLEDVDESMQLDFLDDEALEDVLADTLNPYEAETLQESLGGLRKEMSLFKVASVPIHPPSNDNSYSIPPPESTANVKIFTLATDSSRIIPSGGPKYVSIFFLNRSKGTLSEISIKVHPRKLKYPQFVGASDSQSDEVQVFLPGKDIEIRTIQNIRDAAKIVDESSARLLHLRSSFGTKESLFLTSCPQLNSKDNEVWIPTSSHEDSLFCLPLDLQGWGHDHVQEDHISRPRSDLSPASGKRRLTGPISISHAGSLGKFDTTDQNCHHQCYRVTIRPRNEYVAKILRCSDFALESIDKALQLSTAIWLRIRSESDSDSQCDEWTALVSSIFAIAMILTSTVIKPSHTTPINASAAPLGRDEWSNSSAWQWALEHVSTWSGTRQLKSDRIIERCTTIARNLVSSRKGSTVRYLDKIRPYQKQVMLRKLISTLHLLREVELLNVLSQENTADVGQTLRPVITQILLWYAPRSGEPINSTYEPSAEDIQHLKLNKDHGTDIGTLFSLNLPSVFHTVTCAFAGIEVESLRDCYPILDEVSADGRTRSAWLEALRKWRPFTEVIRAEVAPGKNSTELQETLPEGVAVAARAEMSFVGKTSTSDLTSRHTLTASPGDPELLTRYIFRDDKRRIEAHRLLDPLRIAVAQIEPSSNSDEAAFLEAQKVHAQRVYKRTMAIPSGQAIINFCSHRPMLTEKIHVTSFNTSCNMQPSNNTVNADKSNFTEEKVFWAFFHAGVNAGLRIARDSPGIDTSWLVLNKPNELGNRHAGLLLALGLNGHLKSVAKWLAFKYLTPKHTMTSVGLLLGLSASHLGTMNTTVTRLLSVHITRLLPPGAAELNLSHLTQTAGIMGVGLLYYNSQHRRMSEAMLSEIGHVDPEDPSSPMNTFRDESYRLSAGFALGLINLGKANQLHALQDLRVVERLLYLATGTKEVKTVHILDQATAGATMALAFIFMKSNDKDLANKIDVPTTTQQFDYVRPDILLLRTVARNLIMWNELEPTERWILDRFPANYRRSSLDESLKRVFDEDRFYESKNIPFYNILAGLCWSIGLRFAGSGSTAARDVLMRILKSVDSFASQLSFNYERNLTRNTLTRVDYIIALAIATVMAGTGDLETFRMLRIFHSRTDDIITFGLHQAVHQAIGVLFLGGGRYTFSTSNLAIASLICAFYPIFPKDVLDNCAHLQALRHFWVFAAEARAIIPRDAETGEPLVIPIIVTLLDGTEKQLKAPCLLPELDTISTVKTTTPDFCQVELEFGDNPDQIATFRNDQCIYLRRKSILSKHPSTFASTFATLNETSSQYPRQTSNNLDWIWSLKCFKDLRVSRADALDILPVFTDGDDSDVTRAAEEKKASPVHTLLDMRTTALDDALVLQSDVESNIRERLESLKLLFGWADGEKRDGKKLEWLREEWVQRLRAAVIARGVRESRSQEQETQAEDAMAVDEWSD